MIQSLLGFILCSTVAWLKVQMGLNTCTVTYQITSDQEDRV